MFCGESVELLIVLSSLAYADGWIWGPNEYEYWVSRDDWSSMNIYTYICRNPPVSSTSLDTFMSKQGSYCFLLFLSLQKISCWSQLYVSWLTESWTVLVHACPHFGEVPGARTTATTKVLATSMPSNNSGDVDCRAWIHWWRVGKCRRNLTEQRGLKELL